MQARVIRVLLMGLGELRVDLLKTGLSFQDFPRRAGLRNSASHSSRPWCRGSPHSRSGATRWYRWRGSPVDEDRALDRNVDVLRYCLKAASETSLATNAFRTKNRCILLPSSVQVRIVAKRLEQHAQRFLIVVVVDAEVVHAGGF